MSYVVTKFGGTSVSSRIMWENIATITQQHLHHGLQPVIVCSALTQASNQLEKLIDAALCDQYQHLLLTFTQQHFALAHALDVPHELLNPALEQLQQWLTGIALLKEAPAKTHAQILSLGELMLTLLGHAFLRQKGIQCRWFDAREALISVPVIAADDRSNYCSARCHCAVNPDLIKHFQQGPDQVIITQGFIASNPQGETVLLGRGGSDTSAAIFAAVLNASACEIWTDVPGIYTANPHQLPHARLLKQLHYDEAQEIASMGAKILHPRSIAPVRSANIPMMVKYTGLPDHSGTRIFNESDQNAPPIKSIQLKNSITLISMDTMSMWQNPGFLADIFLVFKKYGLSIDLMSSAESNVTISLDPQAKPYDRELLESVIQELNVFCQAKIIEPCSAVSLIGHQIRRVLPQLGSALEVFDEQQVHLISLAANDLNLTFVIDESKAEKLLQQLHNLLIENNPQSFYYSKSWHEEFGNPGPRYIPWWEDARASLLELAKNHSPCYVYQHTMQRKKVAELKALSSIEQIFYAVKANPHPSILKDLAQQDIHFECVSIQELNHVRAVLPDLNPSRLLFTPNFAAKNEYQQALSMGCYVTVDSLYPLTQWTEIFHNKDILLRLDPGAGAGHKKFVCTGGTESKFGIPITDMQHAAELVQRHQIRVIGLHAHAGSGVQSLDLWQQTAFMLAAETDRFPDVRILNLGGGMSVVEKPGQLPLDIALLDASLLAVKQSYPNLNFWLEPGRFFVAESGVLLAKVTQCKEKGKVRFIGIETGMNSLVRPALYGAYHHIVNLSRWHDNNKRFAHIVGPICESMDTLGFDRMMPETHENDIILIANTGAYGHCMSSSYNLRPAATELIFEDYVAD